jgi:hypothetical protein
LFILADPKGPVSTANLPFAELMGPGVVVGGYGDYRPNSDIPGLQLYFRFAAEAVIQHKQKQLPKELFHFYTDISFLMSNPAISFLHPKIRPWIPPHLFLLR